MNARADLTAPRDAHHAAEAQSLKPEPHIGATFVETEHAPPHADPTALALNGTGWVSLAMLFVILLMLWKGVPAAIGRALDRKIAALRAQLDEAAQLRREAEALRAEYEQRAASAVTEAEAIVAHAHSEAAAILTKAEADAETLVARRGRMAEDKIAAAERIALAEVRAKAAEVAARAAATLIAKRHNAASDRALVDRTIAGLGQRPN